MAQLDASSTSQSVGIEKPAAKTFAIKCTLLIGLLLSFTVFQYLRTVDDDRLTERVLRGTQTLAAASAINPNLDISTDENYSNMFDIFTVMEEMQQKVMAGTEPDTKFLQINTIPDSALRGERVELRYLPRVAYSAALDSLQMISYTGEPAALTIPIQDQAIEGGKPISDAGLYFPVYLQAAFDGQIRAGMNGRNLYNDPMFQLIMDQARDAGMLTSKLSYPLPGADEPYMLAHYFIPLYTPGPYPQTIAERRIRHTGFLSVASFTPAENIIDFLPESYLGLEAVYILDNDSFHTDILAPDVQVIMHSSDYAHEIFTVAGIQTHIIARASVPLRQQLKSTTPWLAMLFGFFLTIWVCSLLYMASIRSSRMSVLITQRTRDLEDKTRSLSDVNQALSESELRYRMLADNVRDVIFSCDAQAICQYISPSVSQQTGFSSKDYLGKPISCLMQEASAVQMHKVLFDTISKAKQGAVQQSITVEYIALCKDSDPKIIECSLSVLYNQQGKFSGILGVSRDITERKKNEQDRASLEIAVQQAQKMEAIGTLAGGVAHDFNNLLTGILGHAELIQSYENCDQEIGSSAGIIEHAAIRAKDLTTQLLGFARKGHYQALPVDITQLIDETVSLMRRTFDKNININCEHSMVPLIAHGDPGQISQIFLNLAVNARDAMKEGGSLLITTSRIEINDHDVQGSHGELQAGRYCQITFTDSGEGIQKKDLTRIFEPFYTNKAKGDGTGLGLAMVYGVTKSHGGMVSVSSDPGKGAVFTVFLPYSNELACFVNPVEELPLRSGHGNVLVVDDETLVRDLAGTILYKLGYQAFLAEHGLDGMNVYKEHQQDIDLVIIDLNMPVMGGIECMEKLIEINPDVKIILATGYSQESFQEQLKSPNIYGFLQKPYRMQQLSELLANVLGEPYELSQLSSA